MNLQHKTIRTLISEMDKKTALETLRHYLPARECDAIYYHDIEEENLLDIGERIHCSESMVKKIRRNGYKRLAASFYTGNE